MSEQTSRRRFLKKSSEIVAASAAISTLGGVHASAQEKKAKLTIGIIGCGGIMTLHVRTLVGRKDSVEIAWLCDVDESQVDRMSKYITNGFQPAPPNRTSNYEDVINDKNVDAVVIATPHHWHAPIAIAAMQAGKDCYIEKPISHVYNEGHAIIKAAKKYGRVVQQGSQMRNSPVTRKAEKLLKDGIIGDVKVARAWTAETRTVAKPLPNGSAPSTCDYDRWLGPAPVHAFNPHRFHGTWRMYQDYGNGEIGDDGIHDLDMACWGLGVDSVPSQITSRGSRMMLHGHASDYPDNMIVTYEYEDGRLLIYENYPFTAYGLHGFDNGNVFYGTDGYMIFSRRGAFSTFLGPKGEPGPTEGQEIRGQRGYAEHMHEFQAAIRNRTTTKANPQTAHYSCALVHLGEIAFRTAGRLDFDPKTETFVDNDDANALLTKEYRKPYTLPEV
jgi:predicted dehydrogenase